MFAAYADHSEIKTDPNVTGEQSNWLQNSSFQIAPPESRAAPAQALEESTECFVAEEENASETRVHKRKRKAKDKRDKKAKDRKNEKWKPTEELDGFSIDIKRNKEFLGVKTIYRPVVSKYRVKYYVTGYRKSRKRKPKRYYQVIKNDGDKSNSDEGQVITKENLADLKTSRPEDGFAGFRQEEDLTNTTASYNAKLAEDPGNVKLWLEYVKFQDSVYQFEKTYRKGSIAKGLRVLAERKLAILDKALTHSPKCEDLLRARLNVAVSVYPADELQVHLKNLVEKDQGNIILWQGYIESTQCSMSHCNTPAVLKLYSKCLSILHTLRRNATMEKSQLEESILKMLYQCGLFLKQAGLFEQLWTLLRLYLELNLSPSDKNKFNISSGFQEKQLVELEEIVLGSQLPLHELWLRTEKLRESCHWLPFSEEGGCEDPQRLVFADDVAELIHPVTMPENIFKLTAAILTLLKVPLLPCRHTTMHALGLDYVPWGLDSIESLLPIFLPLHPVDLTNDRLAIDKRLAVGPQYLNVLPGQEEYADFVLATMRSCADCLGGDDRTAATVWWLRFQRLLVLLDDQDRFRMPRGFQKKTRTAVKRFLRQEPNRNNSVYYCEYALMERDLGDVQSCLNVLRTALAFAGTDGAVSVPATEAAITRCHLRRTLAEVHLKNGDRQAALKHLVDCALDEDDAGATAELLERAAAKFKHVTLQLVRKGFRKLTVVEQFLPDFATDWIVCNGWFLYLTKGCIECGAFVEGVLAELEEGSPEASWQREVLFEFYVAAVFRACSTNPGAGLFRVMDDVLSRAVESFPNNLFVLSVLAKVQSVGGGSGCPWWKLKTSLIRTDRAFPVLFLIIVANQEMVGLQETLFDTVTGQKFEISDSFKNRMLSLFRQITRSDMCTRRCGLAWRLYLQFVHAYFDPTLCRNVYYCAVEECPWLKALYIDAAIYIPAELAQIQDLIIEKQLRIHVTPEELDVLRS